VGVNLTGGANAVGEALLGLSTTLTIGGNNVTVARALLVASATLIAVTVTLCRLAIVDGGVYNPLLSMLPALGFRLHVTDVLLAFVTVAVNCCVWF
jgi:hypothetical protein